MLSFNTRSQTAHSFDSDIPLHLDSWSTESANTKGFTFRVFRSIEELKQLRPAWERLLESVPSATMFSTWEWLSSWWRAYGSGRELLTFGCTDSEGELIGLAPLSLQTQRTHSGLKLRVITLAGDGSGDSDNLDLIIRPGAEHAFLATLLCHLKKVGGWDLARFNTMPDDSPTAALLAGELGRRRWTHFQH